MRKILLFLVFKVSTLTLIYCQYTYIEDVMNPDSSEFTSLIFRYDCKEKVMYLENGKESKQIEPPKIYIKNSPQSPVYVKLKLENINLYTNTLKTSINGNYFSTTQPSLLQSILGTIASAPGATIPYFPLTQSSLSSPDISNIEEEAVPSILPYLNLNQAYYFGEGEISNDMQQATNEDCKKEIKPYLDSIENYKKKISELKLKLKNVVAFNNNLTIASTQGEKISENFKAYMSLKTKYIIYNQKIYSSSGNFQDSFIASDTAVMNNLRKMTDYYLNMVDAQKNLSKIRLDSLKSYITFNNDLVSAVKTDLSSLIDIFTMSMNISPEFYKYETSWVPVSGDELSIKIITTPVKDKLKYAPLQSDSIEYIFPVTRGLRIFFSTGLYITNLVNENYSYKAQSLNDTVTAYSVIKETSSPINAGPVALVHIGTLYKPNFGASFTFGTGFTIEQTPQINFMGGGSILFGQRNRVVVSLLIVTGPVQRLSNVIELNTPIYETNTTTLTIRNYAYNLGASLTYKLFN